MSLNVDKRPRWWSTSVDVNRLLAYISLFKNLKKISPDDAL